MNLNNEKTKKNNSALLVPPQVHGSHTSRNVLRYLPQKHPRNYHRHHKGDKVNLEIQKMNYIAHSEMHRIKNL